MFVSKTGPLKFFAALVALAGVASGVLSCSSTGSPANDPAARAQCSLYPDQGRDPVYARLNVLRRSAGRAPLFYDAALSGIAMSFADSLARSGQIDHAGGPSDRLRQRGLVRRYVAENLARFEHRRDLRSYVVQHWSEQEQESANLLSARYLRMGLGLAANDSHCYAVLILSD